MVTGTILKKLHWLFLLILLLAYICVTQPVHADGGAPDLAYVSGTTQGVSLIDVGRQKVTGTFSIAGDPQTIQLSLDGAFLYVTQPTLGQVATLNAKTGKTVCTAHLPGQPTLLALDPNTNILYTAGNGANRITALNPLTCAIQHIFTTTSPVYGLALTIFAADFADGVTNQLWVAGTDALTIFDDRTGQNLGSVPIVDGPQYLSIPPGVMVYATTRQGSVDAINLKTRTVYQLLTGGAFGPMDYDALSSEVYVPDKKHNLLDILSPITSDTSKLPTEPERVFHMHISPESVAITSDGQLGFVALHGGKVAMLDLLSHQLIYTVDVGGTPHFIITGLYPPTTQITPPKAPPPQASPSSLSPKILIFVLVIVFLALVLFALVLLLVLQLRRLPRTGR